MRVLFCLPLILCLAACQRGGQNNADAVRQGVVDHLVKAKFDMNVMDVKVSSVQFNGEQADATVAVALKGKADAPAMSFNYHLEHQANKWVVVGPGKEATQGGHGGGMVPAPAPGGDDPHGGAMPPTGGGSSKMPSPNDLPPAKK